MRSDGAEYVPAAGTDWARMTPEDGGFDAGRLAEAVAYHEAHESDWPRSMYLPDGRYIGTASIGDRPEHASVLGPVTPRGGVNGLVLRGGRIVAEWGDTARPDMTFSVAKSYLGLLAGLALSDGLIASLDAPVGAEVPGPWFASAHNAGITWRHLLQQTSEWEGELWGKPDSADHNRTVGGAQDARRKGEKRALASPGTHFEYNDVRVNLLAACLTRRFGRALPEVLRERLMGPLGASQDWRWDAYEGAAIEIDGRPVASVPGGGHWGGGMVIGSRDHARMGLLVAREGMWAGRRLVPAAWIESMLSPSPLNAQYGLMWWLNGGEPALHPGAGGDSVFALGAGTSILWIDRAADLVVVARWIDRPHVGGLLARIRAALRD